MEFGDQYTVVLVGAAVGFVAAVLFFTLRKPVVCGKCGAKQPRITLPRSGAEAAGGMRCVNCGTLIDAKGNPRE